MFHVLLLLFFLSMDLATEAMMAEEVWCCGLSTVLVCAWPLYNWWQSLSAWNKAKILLCASTIVGITDTGLDWYVLIGWYSEGYWKIATALLLVILISGSLFAFMSRNILNHSVFKIKQILKGFVGPHGCADHLITVCVTKVFLTFYSSESYF